MTALPSKPSAANEGPEYARSGNHPFHRVLMIAACPFPADRGTPARIFRMAETLAGRGHEVHVATYHLGEKSYRHLFQVHRIPRVPTYRKVDPGPSLQKLLLLDPLLAIRVQRLARRLQPDIIHAHHFEGLLAALPAKKLLSIPVVFDVHVLLEGELEYYRTGIPPLLRQRMARYVDRRMPHTASHVVAVSDEIRDTMVHRHGYPSDRISVIANGVEANFFEGDPARFPKARRRLLFTGNLASYQGIGLMLRALVLVLATRNDVKLTVTTGSSTTEFLRLAQELGVADAIEITDCSLDNLPHMIASADVALNPRTRCPGIPQKLLNYMAGAAPIVSFQGSAKYLRNETTALVVEDDDVDAFAKAIIRILNDPTLAQRLGDNAQLFARQNLSWELNSSLVEQIYNKLVRRQ